MRERVVLTFAMKLMWARLDLCARTGLDPAGTILATAEQLRLVLEIVPRIGRTGYALRRRVAYALRKIERYTEAA